MDTASSRDSSTDTSSSKNTEVFYWRSDGAGKFFLSLNNTVGKQTPQNLSFVYTSYISVRVRTALNFGNHAVPFKYYN